MDIPYIKMSSVILFSKSYAPVTDVERVLVGGSTTDYYRVSFDANYSRDLQFDGAEYGEFVAHPKNKNNRRLYIISNNF